MKDKYSNFIFLKLFICIPLSTIKLDIEHLCYIFIANPMFDFSIKVLPEHSRKDMLKPLNSREETVLMFVVFLKVKNISRKVSY